MPGAAGQPRRVRRHGGPGGRRGLRLDARRTRTPPGRRCRWTRSKGRFSFSASRDNDWIRQIPKLRQDLLETALAQDDDAFLSFIESGDFDQETLKQCIRKGTVSGELVPVFCGSSFKNKGVQQLLDAVVDYLPYPGESGGIHLVDPDGKTIGEQEIRDDAPVRALAFKIINDQFGSLTFIRMYSGVVKKGDSLLNVTRGRKERVGRIVEVQANHVKDIDEARAGDICAFVSLKDTETGDSLCDPDHPALLERLRFPDPVISVSIEPKARDDVDKMTAALDQDGPRRSVAAAARSTRKPARPCCAAWASCTWRSPSTACAPSWASKPTWASRR